MDTSKSPTTPETHASASPSDKPPHAPRYEMPTAAIAHRRTTGSLVAILVGLLMALVLVVAAFLYLTHPSPTVPGRIAPSAPNFMWSSYGRADDLLSRPDSIAVGTDGRIYVSDTGNSRIVVLTSNGGFIESFDVARTDGTKFREPTSLDVASDGRIYVVDIALGGLFILSSSGEPLRTIIPEPERPIGVEVGPNAQGQESLYVTTRSGIIQATLEGAITGSYVRWGGEETMLDTPVSLALGYDDGVVAYVVDSLNYRVQALDSLDSSPTARWIYGTPLPSGSSLRYQGSDRKFGLPVDIALGGDGTLYVLDGLSSTVVMLDAQTGEYRGEFAEAGRGDGYLNMPGGIEYQDGRIYIADKYSDRISVFSDPGEPVAPQVQVAPFSWLPWLIALGVLAAVEVGAFVYLLTVRAPQFLFDASAVEQIGVAELGSQVAAAFGTVLVAGDTDIIAREMLPECPVRSVEFDPEVLDELEDEHPLADAYGLAAIAALLGTKRNVVLVTGDEETAQVAHGLELAVTGVKPVMDAISNSDSLQ